ncbi:MAG: DNA phosphorothioation system restriction enzyme [Thermosynechococcaceae cyanobacterium]
MWANGTANIEVMDFPEAARRSLLKLRPSAPPTREPKALPPPPKTKPEPEPIEAPTEIFLEAPQYSPHFPDGLVLWPYQEQAVYNWFANQGRGTLKMATGSGKTITALAIATQAFEQLGLKALIVICPYRHLVSQWAKECEQFGLKPILAFEALKQWQGQLSSALYQVQAGHQPFLTVITTNTTLMRQGFQSQLSHFPQQTLLVGDEAHNFGASKSVASLPASVPYRLALSATPERCFDEVGTEGIYRYFGPVLEPEFTLRDAIAQGALVRYRYHPILVSLTETETERYRVLAKKIRQLIGMGGLEGELGEDHPGLTPLLLERSRLIGSAANKLVALRELMCDRLDTSHTLFYCGDGTVGQDSTDSQRQLDVVARLLGRELGYRINTYTAETPLAQRAKLHELFASGELQGLVAIRCLDEGVDIPATQTAVILASSNNPRQFVQRRGRILRRYPGKERATLFDMVVVPPERDPVTFEIDRQLLRRELIRFVEFADLADNAGEARLQLLELQKRYELLDL